MTLQKGNSSYQVAQATTEYSLILVGVVAVIILVISVFGEGISSLYCEAIIALGGSGSCTNGCQDDFSNLDNWETDWGEFASEDGKMCNTRRGQGSIMNSCSDSLPSGDYQIKLDDINLERGRGYGVWFRASSNESGRREGYIFQYDPGYAGGAFIMRKWVNGHELPPFAITRARNFDFHGEDHDVEVVVEGNNFKAYVDNVLVLEGTDDTYSNGQAGLRTWDATDVCLSGFSVTP